jgi:hypothetical protein
MLTSLLVPPLLTAPLPLTATAATAAWNAAVSDMIMDAGKCYHVQRPAARAFTVASARQHGAEALPSRPRSFYIADFFCESNAQ